MLGGVEFVAKAERVKEKTTINRVKDVIIMTIDGASDKMVIRAKTLKIRADAEPVEASSMLRLKLWANAGTQKSRAKRKIFRKSKWRLVMVIWLSFLMWCGEGQ